MFTALAVQRTLLGNLFFPKYGALAHDRICWDFFFFVKKTPSQKISSISVSLEGKKKKKGRLDSSLVEELEGKIRSLKRTRCWGENDISDSFSYLGISFRTFPSAIWEKGQEGKIIYS